MQQEASLNTLKSRWTHIISRSSAIPTPHHPMSMSMSTSGSSIVTAAPITVSASSSTSSFAPATLPDEQPTLAGLLQSALGPSEEAIEGGKRFWGQLVKTVSAAAGGTVPMPADDTLDHGSPPVPEEGEGVVPKLDLYVPHHLRTDQITEGGIVQIKLEDSAPRLDRRISHLPTSVDGSSSSGERVSLAGSAAQREWDSCE